MVSRTSRAAAIRTRIFDVGYRGAVRPVLFRTGGGDPEAAHHDTLRRLAALAEEPRRLAAVARLQRAPESPVTVAGITFPHRVGLAAGVDKDGLALRAWPALGLGHVELGTVTGQPQPGNPEPRLFRLPASRGIINRMGFNNAGAAALAARLREVGQVGIPVGVSIGKTKVVPVEDAVDDYLTSVRALDGLADYLAVNVSSPNTPGLRSLQDKEPLRELLAAITSEAAHLARRRDARPVPVFVKVAPDLTDEALDEVLEVAHEADVSGVVATNTTLSRDGLAARDLPLADEAGGLSGAPLTRRSRYVVGRLAQATHLPVIGVGGVMTPDDGVALVDAGAQLVQVYTGLIYRGPALVTALATRLAAGSAGAPPWSTGSKDHA
ncbi:dihydroorotate oxidase A [Barrientosiimonas humi]|uniref:Dihydroorotate dehydrogenase (quinone) n=1 Tax=Barrientosiimonas humi TaxID=999931 RepID=A0A542XDY8_9MICO|nr:quinone-dependent dihydroorotate dehydrogenase [Barrientosiimonas humi]TQL34047.1 dihydroorotate oxidase A [Barrientosiimonas humi]CAG7574038.1 Dihydroorotate dehydrogenase (quinone) [Barrientosiimonas humi]